MSVRAVCSVVILGLAALACDNEPYQYPPLGVTVLVNHGANVSYNFRYRDQKIYSFLSNGADTIAYMRFHYAGDDLESIVTDSSKYSLKLTSFYRSGEGITDSTFLNDTTGTGHHLVSVRNVTFDGDSNPVAVNVKTWSNSVLTEQQAELTWEDGNVVRLAIFNLSTGEKVPVVDIGFSHDDQYCVFMKNNNYLYALALDELYWLSKNNPITFVSGEDEKVYTYWYNKLGYPSNFKDGNGVLYGVAYRQVF